MGIRLRRGWLAKARTHVTSPADVWLVARMCMWSVVLRVLKHVVSLPRLVRAMRLPPRAAARDRRREAQVVVLARWAARLTQWSSRGTCVEQALVAYRYLGALNADPTLIVSVAPAVAPGTAVRGHVWVSVDGVPVDDNDETLDGFHEVVAFTAAGNPIER